MRRVPTIIRDLDNHILNRPSILIGVMRFLMYLSLFNFAKNKPTAFSVTIISLAFFSIMVFIHYMQRKAKKLKMPMEKLLRFSVPSFFNGFISAPIFASFAGVMMNHDILTSLLSEVESYNGNIPIHINIVVLLMVFSLFVCIKSIYETFNQEEFIEVRK